MLFASSEVERLRLSLLGCADSKDKDPGLAVVVEVGAATTRLTK